MIVVEPRVNREKLDELMQEGHESPQLDYKEVLDLATVDHKVKLAKHVGAMQAEGGYIVVGADRNGVPTGKLTSTMAVKFDQASLQAILARWIPDPSALRTSIHDLDRGPVAVIYIATPPAGVCVFADNGVLTDKVVLFRKGETFVRHGTASEKWTQLDFERLVQRQIRAAKEQWRSELSEDMKRLGIASGAQALTRGPATNLTWQLDGPTFDAAVVELLRTDDDIPLREFLDTCVRDARHLLIADGDAHTDFPVVLDRVTCLIAISLRLERRNWVDRGVARLLAIYRIGFDSEGYNMSSLRIGVPVMWRSIAERVEALGALAVRREQWDEVAVFALQRVNVAGFRSYSSWLRHALTMAAQNRVLGDTAEPENRSLIQLAHNRVRETPCLRPDLNTTDEDETLDSLCQFDALASVASLGAGRFSPPYPSFARFYSHRTVPILKRILADPRLRKAIFPGSDEDLAAALHAVDNWARNESWSYSGWTGFSDEELEQFVAKHTSASP